MRIIVASMLFVLWSGVTMAETVKYHCPMHPHYISDAKGSCPICGMDLVEMAIEEEVHDAYAGHDREAHSSNGRSAISISPETIQKIGVRTEAVQFHSFGDHVRSYGVIAPNERLQKKIYSRVDGWVSKLGVSAVGDVVTKGDHIYTIHSPDLVLAQYDLLSLGGRNIDLNKLFVHYEVDTGFVKELRKTRKVKEDVPYYSPYSGTISEINVRQGSRVTLEMPLMVLEDYSSVWVDVSVAEKDLKFLSPESSATVSFSNLSNAEYTAKIDYIYPTIDPATRTGKVRLVLDNEDGAFKPGAYVDVNFSTNVEQRLAIPSEAILKSSDGDYVVVALGAGKFQPKRVHTGIHNQGKTEILHGLDEGEEVVVSSQFLIDSESSLRDAFRKMENTGGTHAGH